MQSEFIWRDKQTWTMVQYEDHAVIVNLQVEDDLKEDTYLWTLLSYWLCIFVFPIKDLNSIHLGTFKIANSMANVCSFDLAILVLASIYRGLNTISSSPTPSNFISSFAIHYIYAWIWHFFRSNRIINDKLPNPLMTKCFGVCYASPFSKLSAREHIRTATNFLCYRIAFKKSYGQTFINKEHLSSKKFDYFMSLLQRYPSIWCEDQHIVEPYIPRRFSQRFRIHQDIPSDLKEENHTDSLKDLYQFYQSCTHHKYKFQGIHSGFFNKHRKSS